ncbi:MAG: DUF6429 family protein [Planctomycetota bacterium]
MRDNFDMDKAAEYTLALMALTICDETKIEGERFARTWKGYDWDVMDHLHGKGYISNPRSKARSVGLTPEGLKRCEELFEEHFMQAGGKQPPPGDAD